MAEVFVCVDETGNLDFGTTGSSFFGIGTATYADDHGDALWQGFRLRCGLEEAGVSLTKGLHAKDDTRRTRDAMFAVIGSQAPRFDTTFLLKANAYGYIRTAGPVRLYKLAFYLHMKEIVRQVSEPGDVVYLVVGHLQTSRKRNAIRDAVGEVCAQIGWDREVVPCIWEAQSSWGIQVADYGLWATQRVQDDRPCQWFGTSVEPTLRSRFTPWGTSRK